MDKARILRLCKEIEKEISEAWNCDVIEYDKAGHIISIAQKIAADIELAPTISLKVRHGWWIPYTKNRDENVTNVFQCSACEKTVRFIMAHKMCDYTFCPFCGAKMR